MTDGTTGLLSSPTSGFLPDIGWSSMGVSEIDLHRLLVHTFD